jgi:selenocysteine lyase/cysteine desulfurase
MDWTSVHAAYPVNEKYIWLNNCGTVPAGTHIRNAMDRFMAGYAADGSLTDTAGFAATGGAVKRILADLLHCKPAEIALIHHTAEGMNYISHGLSLSPGDEIILLENEYPSNVYPWLHWKDKGVTVTTTPMGETPAEFVAELEKRIAENTRIVALSAVHWCTGMPLPLRDIGRLLGEHNVDFVLDGAQGVGMRPIDVSADNISYLTLPAWKWLMGPLGMGALYISEDRLESLKPVFVGTESVIDDLEYFPYRYHELKPTADRFTISTPNLGDWVWFHASLAYLQNIGFDTVMSRIYELSAHLQTRLKEKGYRLLADRFPEAPTGIVVCEKTGVDGEAAVKKLKENKIMCAERLGRIRLSPHIYLLPEQIDRAVDLLESLP